MKMIKRIYKLTSWVVLLTFGFQAGGGNLWAQVIERSQKTEVRNKKETTGKEWQEAIEGLEGVLEDFGKRGIATSNLD